MVLIPGWGKKKKKEILENGLRMARLVHHVIKVKVEATKWPMYVPGHQIPDLGRWRPAVPGSAANRRRSVDCANINVDHEEG